MYEIGNWLLYSRILEISIEYNYIMITTIRTLIIIIILLIGGNYE